MQIEELRGYLAAAADGPGGTKFLNLTNKNIDSTPCIKEVVSWISKYHPSQVFLENCNLSDSTSAIIADYIRSNTSVVLLSLRNNFIGSRSVMLWADVLRENQTLQSVDFVGNKLGDGVHELTKSLKFSRCRSLCGQWRNNGDLMIKSLKESDAYLIGADLEKNTDLKFVEIYGASEFIGLEYMLTALEDNRTLIRLKMTGFSFTKKITAALASGLSRNTSLRSLDLVAPSGSTPSVISKAMDTFFRGMEDNTSITSLRLENVPMEADIVDACSSMLQRNRTLLHFSLFNCGLSDSGDVDAFCRGLERNNTLSFFRFAKGTEITLDSYRDIRDAANSRQLPIFLRCK